MKVEKFTKDGVSGVRISNATFAASKNHNGCHFDPLEVFSVNPPEQFNVNHGDQEVKFEWESKPQAVVEDKLLRFTADLVSYDEYAIENAEKFSGLSPELLPVNQPARRGKERFYAAGDLQWSATAALYGQKPGFVGADEFQMEKFSLMEDVVIKENFTEEEPKEEKPAEEPKIETEEPKESQPAQRPEQFALSWVEIGEFIKVRSTGQIGRVEKVEKTANGQSITIRLTDGTETSFSEVETTDDRALDWINVSDVMDFILSDRGVEGFSAKNQDDSKNNDQEDEAKQKEMNQKMEQFDSNLSKAKEMAKAGKTEKFTKEDPVENDGGGNGETLAKIRKKLFK